VSDVVPSTLKKALVDWVKSASGIDRVILARQGGFRPDVGFFEIDIQASVGFGQDWRRYEPNPLEFDDITISVDSATDLMTAVGHGLRTGDGPVDVESTLTLPGGLSLGVPVWVIRVTDDTFKVASTFENSMAGTSIDLTSNGTGVITISDNEGTERQGQELIVTAMGHRQATVVIQCFGSIPQDSDNAVPFDARQQLENVIASLALYEYDLDQAGIGVVEAGAVVDITQGRAGILEPRARCQLEINLAANVSAFETRIATIEMTVNPENLTSIPVTISEEDS
jgi:hypothetical protein